jgi:hypothetical protein
MTERQAPRYNGRADILRSTNSYNDLLRIVASYYEMYERGARFLSPYISRQNSSDFPFIPPDKDMVKSVMGKPRSCMHSVVHNNFMNEMISFAEKTKGSRALIQPHQTTHHSAQFSSGTFEITKAPLNAVPPSKSKVPRKTLHAISVFGSDACFFVENLQLSSDDVHFIIVRPKLGKLGTASINNWEVLLYKSPHGYLIDHVDSDLNPTYAGRF